MDQSGGLQGLSRLLQSRLLRRKLAQLVVDQRQKLISCERVAPLDGTQDLREAVHLQLDVGGKGLIGPNIPAGAGRCQRSASTKPELLARRQNDLLLRGWPKTEFRC